MEDSHGGSLHLVLSWKSNLDCPRNMLLQKEAVQRRQVGGIGPAQSQHWVPSSQHCALSHWDLRLLTAHLLVWLMALMLKPEQMLAWHGGAPCLQSTQ